ncbi:pirin family protein [Paenibacillus woosongensis]|uniref:Pirin family protein n=1 Tax=Paenibacillus woosongensis TaxID=307580 RepID=A0AA95I8D2_9BACL|nr:pirin family protein [Paenibacillus woosongensis]WHX48422.1 pirin family protein [Paenibacillus woosongensis]
MIKVVTAEERHTSDKGAIHSEFSFSFADYDDPSNAHFGCLLALNDNVVQPGQGLAPHPHHDLEIVTYVVSGTLRHEDDLGNRQDLAAGSVQVMSAGAGIRHAESNPSPTEPVRFIQMWFLPVQRNLRPAWDSRWFPWQEREGLLKPVIEPGGSGGSLRMNQDVRLFIPNLQTGEELVIPFGRERRTHLFMLAGHIDLYCGKQKFPLRPGDAARIRNAEELSVCSTGSEEAAEFILIDLP